MAGDGAAEVREKETWTEREQPEQSCGARRITGSGVWIRKEKKKKSLNQATWRKKKKRSQEHKVFWSSMRNPSSY